MIKTRLLSLLQGAKRFIAMQVLWQWISLLAQIVLSYIAARILAGSFHVDSDFRLLIAVPICIAIRYICDIKYTKVSFLASSGIKRVLRTRIYEKMIRLGASYREQISTAEVVQMQGEGVEQLETYFGRYLSQLFYSVLAPLTLFCAIISFNMRAAIILLAIVPLIPVVMGLVMSVAKRILGHYFEIYYGLGDHFLERLSGMTTLKIYQADQAAADDMDREAEQFRRVTMKVLSMQLNSTVIMDLVAYGGAAVGIITALLQYRVGAISLTGMFLTILLAAEFFLPMRLLGSFFHIGMNGIKASDRIFAFLDLPEPDSDGQTLANGPLHISVKDLGFGYTDDRTVLEDISLDIPSGSFVSIVGVSGSGKSTIASILMGRHRRYSGSVAVNGIDLQELCEATLMEHITYIGTHSWIFKGTVREYLLEGNSDASDVDMLRALRQVNLLDFIESENGLDTELAADGANLSGGQRQRLALARALLHDTPVYIFDEATSNIDAESEQMILDVIHELAHTKSVLMISHRLANITTSDKIYMLEHGRIVESGTHRELLGNRGPYAKLYSEQAALESYVSSGSASSKRSDSLTEPKAYNNGDNYTGLYNGNNPDDKRFKHMNTGTLNEPTDGTAHISKVLAPRRSGFRIMSELIGLIRPLRGVMLLGITLGVLGFLCAIFLTVIAGYALSTGIPRTLLICLMTIALLRGILHYGEQYCNHYIAFRILALIRHQTFAALRRLCPAKLEGRDKGDLLQIITSDIELLEVFFAHTISPIFIAFITSLFMIIFIGRLNLAAGLVALISYLTIGVFIPIWNGRRSGHSGATYRSEMGLLNDFALGNLYGLDETIQYGMGAVRLSEMNQRSGHLSRLQLMLSKYEGSQRGFTNLMIQAFSWTMLLMMMNFSNSGSATRTEMILCTLAMMASFGPVVALSSLSNNLNQTLACGDRVLSLLEEIPEVEEVSGCESMVYEDAAVEDVTFAYGKTVVLEGISLKIAPNSVTGIGGASGIGKSTLLKLIMRFWDVQSGRVVINGRNIRSVNTNDLRTAESYLTQDTVIFHDTLATNISIGKLSATQDEIETVAKKAGIHDFIMTLPQGYRTKAGELGDTLSGGEKQRIGLARAFLHDAPLMLLDEPTSNLDALNEALILKSIAESRANKTVVIVSHRPSTMSIADEVVELRSERIS